MTTAKINFHWENEKPHVSIVQYDNGIPDSVLFRLDLLYYFCNTFLPCEMFDGDALGYASQYFFQYKLKNSFDVELYAYHEELSNRNADFIYDIKVSEIETDSGYTHEWNVKCTNIISSDMSNLRTTHKIINENTVMDLIRKDPMYNAIDKLLTEFIKREDKQYYGRFMPILLSKSSIKI
ncbi:MAG: hypothetical protein ACFE8E_12375 [Candidatus Hodarchaeota archaeon]